MAGSVNVDILNAIIFAYRTTNNPAIVAHFLKLAYFLQAFK